MENVSGCRVVLIGMMGSGKSTIGRLLSESTGWPYRDNDDLLFNAGGKTARELLDEGGTARLRSAEDAALNLGLRSEPPCIVAVAGGTILSEMSRAALGEEIVVYLRTAPETLFERARGATHRPWLDSGEEWFAAALAERSPLYESVADLTVDSDRADPPAIAREIREWLREVEPCATSLGSDS